MRQMIVAAALLIGFHVMTVVNDSQQVTAQKARVERYQQLMMNK